jgi:hypothetical protein
MSILDQITQSSPVAKVVVTIAGLLVLYVAFKVGSFILKILLGLVGIALVVGAIWWFFVRH